MNVSVLEADKIVVGTNDVSFTAPDQSPTGCLLYTSDAADE